MSGPDLDDYLRLFTLYRDLLREVEDPHGNRLELLFGKVAAMLVDHSPMNKGLPTTFCEVAQRWRRGESETRAHFSHDDNRFFFLSDLHDYLRLQALQDRRRDG